VSRRVEPPSGWPPPDVARLAGATVDLHALADTVAERYFERYPEDLERYGEAARAWECHDTQHLLNWAIGDVEGWAELDSQVRWLAGVLEARDFPLDHLAGNLELAADVVEERVDGGASVAQRLRGAAAVVTDG
jgi:hypothetical protein